VAKNEALILRLQCQHPNHRNATSCGYSRQLGALP